jgi:hypothetical protein
MQQMVKSEQNQKNHTHTHKEKKTSVVVSCRDIIPFLSREIIPKQKLSRLVSKSKLQRCCSQYVISEPACLQKKYFSLQVLVIYLFLPSPIKLKLQQHGNTDIISPIVVVVVVVVVVGT